MMQKQPNVTPSPHPEWIPLSRSIILMVSRKQLLGWSLVLFLITVCLTWIGYLVSVDFMDRLTGDFMATAPAADTIWGWIKHQGWVVGSWLFLIVSRIVAFYIAFLLAYTLSTPGYAFLSAAAEKLHAGEAFDGDAAFTVAGVVRDIFEGIKIALFGIVVTIAALVVNFVPGIGQAAVVLLYTYYSTLMFIDYPASRRRWSLGRKLDWLRTHSGPAFRIGLLPALISMIPLVNIFAIALLFPLLTIHASLNFSAIELARKLHPVSPGGRFYGHRD
jgi:CysZ protein